MSKKFTILLHIVYWSVHLWIGWYWWQRPYLEMNGIWMHVVFVSYASIVKLLMFYTNYFYLLPKVLFKGRVGVFIPLELCLLYFGHGAIVMSWHNWDPSFIVFLPEEHIQSLVGHSFDAFFGSMMFVFLNQWAVSKIRNEKLEHELKVSELNFLNAQTSPHFLFNTLNNIYSLSVKKDKYTSVAANQLKNMMQYIEIFESGKKIKLETELQFIQDFVALHQLRSTVKVKIDKDIEDGSVFIHPMLLIPFIENAFKHGDTSNDSIIQIRIQQRKDDFRFNIENSYSVQKRKDSTSGVGIENVKKRVELLFEKSELFVKQYDGKFTVDLKIQL